MLRQIDAVRFRNLPRMITEQGKLQTQRLGEPSVGFVRVGADSEDRRVRFREFGDTSLVRLYLSCSATGKRLGEERQHDGTLAAVVR